MSPINPINPLLSQVTLAKATELARTGRYLEAESFLTGLIQSEEIAIQAIDLLARIRAQQGRLGEADALWHKVLELDPLNEPSLSGLRRINQLRRPLLIPGWAKMLIVVAICFTFIAGLSGFLKNNSMTSQIPKDIPANDQKENFSRLNELSSSQKLLSQDMEHISSLLAMKDAASKKQFASQASSHPLPEIKIDLPGVLMKNQKDKLLLSFESGLFSKGSKFKPEAPKIIATLGELLKPCEERIAIHVVGYTDNIPLRPDSRYIDNVELGLKRAIAVVDCLRKDAGLSSTPVTIEGAGADKAPFPNDTYDNRLRNRTVMLQISSVPYTNR